MRPTQVCPCGILVAVNSHGVMSQSTSEHIVQMDQAGDARASHRGWLSLRTPAPVHHLPPRTSSPNGTLSVPAAEGHPGAIRHRWAGKCRNHSKLEEKAVGKAPHPAPEQKRIEVGDIHYLHGQELEFSMFGKK